MHLGVTLLSVVLICTGHTLAQTYTTEATTEEPLYETEVTEVSETTTYEPETTPDEPETTTDEPETTTEEPEASTLVPSTSTGAPSVECSTIKNGIATHSTDCDKYIVCHDAVGTVRACPQGQILSWRTLSCGTTNVCSEYFNGLATLDSVACGRQTERYAEHPYQPNRYVNCANLTTESCAANKFFRWTYQRCLPGSAATNQGCGFWEEKPHPYLQCERYLQCRFWVLKTFTCRTGMIYDASSNKCRLGDFQTCRFAF